VVDNIGIVIDHITYDSFGRIVGQTTAIDFRFAYTGREWDTETGQYYNRARYYDPTVGGFINEDPLGFGAGDTNLKRYVGNSPTNYTDPSGLICGSVGTGTEDPWGWAVPVVYIGKSIADGIGNIANNAGNALNDLGNKLFTPNNPEQPPQLLPFPNPDRNRLHLGNGPETFQGQPGNVSSNPPGFNLDPVRSPFREGFGTDRPNLSPSHLSSSDEYGIPDSPVGGLKGVRDNWLKGQGVDPHTVKDSLPGKSSEFDIYKDKDGNLWGLRKPEYVPNAVPDYLGNINDFKQD
jgi:RHS repeat-associated protein